MNKVARTSSGSDSRGAITDFARASWLVLAKDLRIEWRTKEIVTVTAFFGVLVTFLSAAAFNLGPEGDRRVAPGTIWLTILFSTLLSVTRAWHREREENCFFALCLAPIPRGALLAGKAAGVFLFAIAIEVLTVSIAALVLGMDLPAIALPLSALLIVGTIGVAWAATLFGAMTVRTQARDLLLATVLFPLLSPTLLSGVGGTRELISGGSWSDLRDYFVLLGIFDFMVIALGLGFFGLLVDEG